MISPHFVIYLQILALTFVSVSIQSVEYYKVWPTTQKMQLPLKIPKQALLIWPFLLLSAFFLPAYSGWLLLIAFIFHLSICARFKGTFNGGSDYMTAYTLIGLTITGFVGESKFGILWIGTSLLLSYFIAGAIKIKEAAWRSGLALEQFFFINRSPLCPPQLIHLKLNRTHFQLLSWFVMIVELMAPVVLWIPELKLTLMGFFAFFHFLNFWVFGLNRFFWAWIATYPALFILPEL